jgi:hypothetical protein
MTMYLNAFMEIIIFYSVGESTLQILNDGS